MPPTHHREPLQFGTALGVSESPHLFGFRNKAQAKPSFLFRP